METLFGEDAWEDLIDYTLMMLHVECFKDQFNTVGCKALQIVLSRVIQWVDLVSIFSNCMSLRELSWWLNRMSYEGIGKFSNKSVLTQLDQFNYHTDYRLAAKHYGNVTMSLSRSKF